MPLEPLELILLGLVLVLAMFGTMALVVKVFTLPTDRRKR
jgi:hypothetical protein